MRAELMRIEDDSENPTAERLKASESGCAGEHYCYVVHAVSCCRFTDISRTAEDNGAGNEKVPYL